MRGPLPTGSCKRCGCAPLAPAAGQSSPAPAGWQCIKTTGKWLARDCIDCMRLWSTCVAWQYPELGPASSFQLPPPHAAHCPLRVCCRRVLRELYSTPPGQNREAPAALPQPALQVQQPSPPPAAERVVQAVWYTVVVCTSGAEGAGLAPVDGGAVFLVLHGRRGSSQRVKLPSQPGDFEQGQADVFRCACCSCYRCRCPCFVAALRLAWRTVGWDLDPAAEEERLLLILIPMPQNACVCAGCSCLAWARSRS